MERKTIKKNKEYNVQGSIDWAINKLGRLEDIEEEIGFDLEIILKGIINGICFRGIDELEEDNIGAIYKYENKWCFTTHYSEDLFYFDEYREEWALEEEDLPREEEDY